MKFSRIIGKIDPKLIAAAEERLSQVFLELATRYTNQHIGTNLGGDPLIFALMYPVEHIATLNISTAATCGKRYYWNPKFILKQHRIGLRIVCAHEAWHAIYMHPSRRGSRIPKLWNIAVDYIVNGTIMEDFKARKMDPHVDFTKYLGRYMPLKDYMELLKDPFAVIPGFEDLKPGEAQDNNPNISLPAANEDRELSPEEQKELERREKRIRFYYADPNLDDDTKRPEKIYDLLYALLPKCPKCGRVGMYQLPGQKKDKDKNSGNESTKDKSEPQSNDDGQEQQSGQGSQEQSDQGQGQQPGNGQSKGPCDHCGGGVDVFGLGGTVDDHMDTSETQEKLAKRISDAMAAARQMAGHVPGALEDELGKLTAPKITIWDIIRSRLIKSRAGNSKNDWTRFRSRPLFTGLLIPKRKSYHCNIGVLLDTSGSMGKDDMAFGVSQLQSLDEKGELTVVPCDATCYWDKATKIKKCNMEELSKIKIIGRCGTMFAEFFSEYEKNIGKCDFLIILTDGFLSDTDIAEMKNPGVPVYWVITSKSGFNAPFGKVYDLHD